MRSLLLLTIVLSIHSPSVFANPEDRAECRSQDVWDAGYVMSFDLSAKAGNETAMIPTEIFELVPLWEKKPVFSGPLILAAEPEACEFVLENYTANPSVVLHFKISPETQDIQILELNGRRPERFTKLDCQTQLIDRLAQECTAHPSGR